MRLKNIQVVILITQIKDAIYDEYSEHCFVFDDMELVGYTFSLYGM